MVDKEIIKKIIGMVNTQLDDIVLKIVVLKN